MPKRLGKQTIALFNKPQVLGYAAAVGKKEKEGPLADEFELFFNDPLAGQDSFEKAESYLQQQAFDSALKNAGLRQTDINALFAGDLLNQCISSSFAARDTGIPLMGVYGACSTMALSLALAAIMVDSGAAKMAAAVTSSHFCSAERQYRFPLEYGCQRTPTAQWTVTGSGAVILGNSKGKGAYIDKVCFGTIRDLGISDANNMGAAMAPAAADTIRRFFNDTNTGPSDYDAIFTGDLGKVGTDLLRELLLMQGINISSVHNDCGLMIFDRNSQDVHAGGSGCGCSASVLAGYILKRIESGEYKNILFCATGALLSPTSSMQGESIPGIAHLLNIRNGN